MADARLTLRQAAEGEGGLVGRLVGRLEAHAELWRQQGRLLGELDKMESTQPPPSKVSPPVWPTPPRQAYPSPRC